MLKIQNTFIYIYIYIYIYICIYIYMLSKQNSVEMNMSISKVLKNMQVQIFKIKACSIVFDQLI